MRRLATLAVAAFIGALLAGCGGNFGQAGVSLPTAGDGVQTVADAADALDAHQSSASESAKAAIAVTDALGSFVRDISADQRALALAGTQRASAAGKPVIHTLRRNVVELNGRRILSGSELLLRSNGGNVADYCQSSAGYSVTGIPSLDESFGWESGAFSTGSRTLGERGMATWSANASGAVVQGAIGSLSIARGRTGTGCPKSAPAFALKGGSSTSEFSIPIAMAFRRGELWALTVSDAKFSDGARLSVTTKAGRQPAQITGIITKGRTGVATFHTNAAGNGALTITSTGAQYIIADWIVVGT
ncbi:MAG: hypothetical protein JO104_03545 [Candidatus Eremiobacteraeota bacterium]|nr:hypothetical protein [Candidatus Eremiobacteraeota bacterium]